MLTENDNFQFFTNFQIDKGNLNIIMIEAVSKNSSNKYHWTYSTMDYLIEMTNKGSQDIYILIIIPTRLLLF